MEVRNNITQFSTPKRLVMAAAIATLCAGFAAPAAALDMEELLEKLHNKGILNDGEFEEMRKEARKDKRDEAAKKADEEAKKPTKLSGKFDNGFKFESGDKQNSIALKGRLQADYRRFDNDSGTIAAGSAASADTFDVRRAYIGIAGKVYGDWEYEVIADVAQGTAPQLDTGWINYAGFKPIQVMAGQFKMPFSLEEMTSDVNTDFQERSMGNAMVPNKERGVMVWGIPADGLYYYLAASNGAGKNAVEANALVDSKDFIGRAVVNLAEVMGNKDAIIHLGLDYTNGTIPVGATIAGRTEGRGLTFFTSTAFTGQSPVAGAAGFQEMDRTRTGAELALAYNQFKLQGEWLNANYEGTSGGATGIGAPVAFDRDITTYYVSATWLITGEKYGNFYKGGILGAIKPNSVFNIDGSGYGAWEVGARYSKWDATDFNFTNPVGTGVITNNPATCAGAANNCLTNEADAITIGLKWLPNAATRFDLNYIRTDFETPVSGVVNGTTNSTTTTEHAITLRGGISF